MQNEAPPPWWEMDRSLYPSETRLLQDHASLLLEALKDVLAHLERFEDSSALHNDKVDAESAAHIAIAKAEGK